ncbi:hypothetical protein L3X39_10630 [Sabulilitoribacter multivorans]|uniref:Uncharacterized protein n=1 Tax=Flaviramulus multivorans TaxID=1304750 RepID=A0ABS9IKF6_9FLAO|nr:hypothetical protein [Flaviramulus multivorans]MCF7561091.1 hypothetical protein [Flaviramulus multivorans]
MSKHYKEKALLATTYKIEKVKKQSGYFKSNINKVIILAALFSFLAPFYSNENGKSMKDLLEISYTESVVFAFIVVSSFCLIGHVVWTIQDKSRLKELMKRKKELEEDIKSYDL